MIDRKKNTDAVYTTLHGLEQPRNAQLREIALYFFVHAHGSQWELQSTLGGANSWWLYHESGRWYRVRVRHGAKDVEVKHADKRIALWKDRSSVAQWFWKIERTYLKSQKKKAA